MYDILEKILKEKNISFYRLSKETGISTATFSSWKKGKYIPKQDKLEKICDYLNISMTYLLTGKENNEIGSHVKIIKNTGELIIIPFKKLENLLNEDPYFEYYLKRGLETQPNYHNCIKNVENIVNTLGFSLNKINENYYSINMPLNNTNIYATKNDIIDIENSILGYLYRLIENISKKNIAPKINKNNMT